MAFFGIISGIITTPGLMVGRHSATHTRTVVIGGIVTIAIADAFPDALAFIFQKKHRKCIPIEKSGLAHSPPLQQSFSALRASLYLWPCSNCDKSLKPYR